jgi:hypothetical protein
MTEPSTFVSDGDDNSYSSSQSKSDTQSDRTTSTDMALVVVDHGSEYHDYGTTDADSVRQILGVSKSKRRGPRGGVVTPFPMRLYDMLEKVQEEDLEKLVSWQPHGRCFVVRRPNDFVKETLPR